MSDSFVHLHVHTEYSMLDGAAKMSPLFGEAERLGMPAIAMSDHGNMFGAYEFHKVAKGGGVKPIIGIEAYVAPENRFHKKPVFWGSRAETGVADGEGGKDVSGGGRFTHMTMWAKDADGLRNLFRLSSLASFEGYYSKPRMDMDLISQYASGIIATTGCPSGAVQTRLRLGQYEEAVKVASAYQDMFGKENYFLELMDHGIDIEREVRADLLRLAKQLDIPLLVTNDSHYVTEDQADAHDSLLCVGVGKNKDDPNRFRFNGSGYYLKSAAEMRELFSELPQACDNTLLVAEMVGDYSEVFAYVDRMPQFPDVPEGETQESWLRKEVERGLELRYGTPIPDEVQERYETEMKVIGPMGFSSYFLVVADICKYARDNGIPVGPGRGSATGSIVAYATRITELDPLEHGLLFERFLNPERINPPDVDLDFDDRQRDRMVAYVTEKYGKEMTAQVNTFGTIKAKAAVKDAARILGYPFVVGDKITKAMPPDVMGKGVPLAKLFDKDHPRYVEGVEIRALYDNDADVKKVIDTGRGIEGLIRGTGVHAAAVILSSHPLLDLIPMHMRDKDGVVITGFDYPSCEEMGLVKMDFLGLRNLGIIDHAIKIIEQNRGVKLDTLTIPLDDETTYKLLARGDTLGVFQLDGGPMRQLLKLMEPTRFEDIAAVLALYRPGPMAANAHTNYAHRKNARQDIEPIHPELKDALDPILGPTFHLLVYQEQIMAVARELAGYTLGGADLLRRAMGKKKPEILAKEFVNFQAGMRGNGYSDESIQALWDVMLPFSGYAFNKSHTAGYGLVAYWTAYLKANYPAEYMAALLTSVGDDKDKAAVYLAECRKMGIQVLPPDVNDSQLDFVAVGDDKVRFGMGAVRNVGENVVEGIVKARKDKGAYTDFNDFLDKVPLVVCNKRVIESLIKAGGFDSLDHPRKGLLMIHEQAVDSVIDIKKNEAHGQDSLFGGLSDAGDDQSFTIAIPDLAWDKKTQLDFEREMLGLYVSDHPLAGTERLLARNRDTTIADLLESGRDDRGDVRVCGLITKVDKRVNKAGNMWAIATVEDMDAAVECLFFPKTYELYAPYLREDLVASVGGQINNRDGAISVFAQDLTTIDISSVTSDSGHPVTIQIREERLNERLVEELRNVLKMHEGSVPLRINLRRLSGQTMVLAVPEFPVNAETSFAADIKALFGPEAITL
ncbi:DNA polymerase III subunit alpha [Nonomuraea roseoviolacea]|uniref:DNA polymerase III subunit alpha n=1 Tax=Nonomuraea roseoviolacea subsp. carminata TaxID=160689 RepID=A0ABT1JWA8_9ACTN|nr:DNA polymerase III subunit alpha [Nonomuraea roseoviolacea]MCP2346050.1 DNA polymerase-3 subunit alpha [Nonomuraea roseoviolacea subsp. carminata]